MLAAIIIAEVFVAIDHKDIWGLFITLLPIHTFVIMLFAWFFYKNPTGKLLINEKVVVIVPVYNQKDMIRQTLAAIYSSTYKNLAVICVNDGSTDETRSILDEIKTSGMYPELTVIHKKNGGKRKAVATAFYYQQDHIKANYIVMIDSDSIVHPEAIKEMMKAFSTDIGKNKIGAVVGQAKVWNASKNILTRCQSSWYDTAFNLEKCTQSYFGNVLCCSGCLAAYRIDAIKDFLPFWITTSLKDSEDRELTTYVISPGDIKRRYMKAITKERRSMANRLRGTMRRYVKRAELGTAAYDYAEDRALSAAALSKAWQTVYVASAIVYTDVPENWRTFLKQQKRWKKGTIRVSCYVALFFWRKNPILSIAIFYVDFIMTFLAGILLILSFTYIPYTTQSIWYTLLFLSGSMSVSFVHGLDFKMRDPASKTWMYRPLMNMITGFVLAWMWIPALLAMRSNEWGTRNLGTEKQVSKVKAPVNPDAFGLQEPLI